jgi:hypothetical protein
VPPRPGYGAPAWKHEADVEKESAVICYRDSEHENPAEARFCVRCGTPLQQPCPYQPDHQVTVANNQGESPATCPICRQLLRPCDQCRRLHKLGQQQCLTGSCHGRALPPVRSDWPALGGSVGRSGSFRLRRVPESGARSYRQWEWTTAGRHAAGISAFGMLYVSVDAQLMIVERDLPRVEWPAADLRSPVAPGPGALLAGDGHLFALAARAAHAFTPDRLARVSSMPGRFTHQTLWNRHWLLFGAPDGEPEPQLLAVPTDNVTAPPNVLWRATAEEALPKAPPVVAEDGVYWSGRQGQLYRLNNQGVVSRVAAVNGEIVALAAPPPGTPFPGAAFLSATSASQYHLHFLNPQQSAEVFSAAVTGTRVLDRVWAAGRYVFAARNGNGEDPGMLRFDAQDLARRPETLSWARGLQIMDALLLDTPDGLWAEIVLRDATVNTALFTRQFWETQAVTSVGRAIGTQQVSLLVHGSTIVSVESALLGAEQTVNIRQFIL